MIGEESEVAANAMYHMYDKIVLTMLKCLVKIGGDPRSVVHKGCVIMAS